MIAQFHTKGTNLSCSAPPFHDNIDKDELLFLFAVRYGVCDDRFILPKKVELR